ncbi:MAG: hypothetical protein ABFD70_04325 [Syntrophaceae bacterium]
MDSIPKDMKIMAKSNGISHDQLAAFLFSSYRARIDRLRGLGLIPAGCSTNDLTWLSLLFLQDRGYLPDISSIRLSRTDSPVALGIIGLIMDGDRLRAQQHDLLQQLRKKVVSSVKRAEKIHLVEAIEEQLEKIDDFIGTFCKHIRMPKNEQTEMIWGCFVKNRTVEKILSEGNELIQKGPKVLRKET